MSFLKKTLASFGIGSAKVDAVLHQEVLIPGESVAITIHVYGGATEQAIDHIDVKLCCQYVEEVVKKDRHTDAKRRQKEKRHFVLDSWQLPYSFTINPSEEREFEVNMKVPWNTPVTIGDSKVWLETSLDIDSALDPKDEDRLTVRPDPVMDGIFSELEEQGLRIRQVECEAAKGFELPFVQQFEFVPTTGPYHGLVREVELLLYRDPQQLQIWVEIDRQKKGLGGMISRFIGNDEITHKLTIALPIEPAEAGQKVLSLIDQLRG